MNHKQKASAFSIIRKLIHDWKPITWASYDDDEPAMFPDDPDYQIAKSMLSDETDPMVNAILKQLPRVKTETDLAFVLYKVLGDENECITLETCKIKSRCLFFELKNNNIL